MITTSIDNAEKLATWIKTGGIAVWRSINLSNPGYTVFTPAESKKPNWQVSNKPAEIVTDPAQVVLVTWKEVTRFRVATRISSNGLTVKLTDASNRKLNAKLAKYGSESGYRFDYETQEAVILMPDKSITLAEWIDGK